MWTRLSPCCARWARVTQRLSRAAAWLDWKTWCAPTGRARPCRRSPLTRSGPSRGPGAYIACISKIAYALATPRCLDWRRDRPQTSRNHCGSLLAIVQEIGAGGGLAAVLGLAVLSVLYFSHARDVKRLREWAGRAPERTAVPARAAAPPAAAATGAGSATAQQSRAGVPVTSPPRRSQPWYRRIGARYVAVALVGLLVLGGAAANRVTRLTGDDGGDNSGNAQANNKPKPGGGAVKPGNVTVAVLNGTTVPGLAAALRDQTDAAGFREGTINNFSDQQLAESVVD